MAIIKQPLQGVIELDNINLIKPRLDTFEAATYLNCSPYTLRRSRSTGILFGVQAPAYIKRGRKVDYELKTLQAFQSQFIEQLNTAGGKA